MPKERKDVNLEEIKIMSIDLHIHSTASDGTMSPVEVVKFAKKKGLRAIAITDHDTFEGVPEAMETGHRIGIEVIPGLELSVKFQDTTVHLLGYLFDYKDELLGAAIKKLQNGRKERNLKILKKLNELGLETDFRELQTFAGIGQIGRPHIAKLLINRGWAVSMDDAFEQFLGKQGKIYITRFAYSLKEACGVIHDAGGISVLAHPANLIKTSSGELKTDLLRRILSQDVDGVEAYYPTHTRKFRRKLIAYAEKNGLIMTGGSDYHGDIRPGTTLAGGKNVSVPITLLEKMKRYKAGLKNC